MHALRPIMQPCHIGRGIGLQQITLGGREMRLGRSTEPDISAGVLRLGPDLRQDFTG